MEAIMIAAGIATLLLTPMFAYALVWFTAKKGESSGGRPEPPRANRTGRTIPGSDSGNSD